MVFLPGVKRVLTTKGDIEIYSNTYARLPIGAVNGYVLTVDSTLAAGMKWAAAGSSSTPGYLKLFSYAYLQGSL